MHLLADLHLGDHALQREQVIGVGVRQLELGAERLRERMAGQHRRAPVRASVDPHHDRAEHAGGIYSVGSSPGQWPCSSKYSRACSSRMRSLESLKA